MSVIVKDSVKGRLHSNQYNLFKKQQRGHQGGFAFIVKDLLQSMIHVKLLRRIIFVTLCLSNCISLALTAKLFPQYTVYCRRQCATALLQQEFIFPSGTILSQTLMEASFPQTNSPTVLQCTLTGDAANSVTNSSEVMRLRQKPQRMQVPN